jgi:hypothetical protein
VPKAELSAPVDPIAPPPESGRSRVGVAVATVIAVLALGVGIPVFSVLTGPGGPFAPADPDAPPDAGGIPVVHVSLPEVSTAGPDPGPSPSLSTTPGSAGPSPTSATPAVPPATGTLRARYQTTGQLGANSYEGQVTISNLGGTAVDGWTVRITLPAGERVSDAAGVHSTQDGTTVTFTPIGRNKVVPAQGTVRFTFVVANGSGAPTGCTVDGRPCD